MTHTELTNRLKEMYENAPHGDATTMIRLFGIKYAKELKDCGVSMDKIARDALGKPKYDTEINKGIRLARYVQVINS